MYPVSEVVPKRGRVGGLVGDYRKAAVIQSSNTFSLDGVRICEVPDGSEV